MSENPLRTDVWVHYGQVDLMDSPDVYDIPPMGGPPVGILAETPGRVGNVKLLTGLHTGEVFLTVSVTDTDPGPELHSHQDAVELSVYLPNGAPILEEWGGGSPHDLPPLPAGPGWYRLRYHARDADVGLEVETLEEDQGPVDSYLLQIWPEAHSEARILRAESDFARNWLASPAG